MNLLVDEDELLQIARELQRIYKEQLKLYKSLLSVCRQQRAVLEKNGENCMTEFVDLLEKKDALIRQMGELERRADPLKRKWMAFNGVIELPRQAAKINKILDDIVAVIEEVMALEKENERVKDDLLLKVRRQFLRKGSTITSDKPA